VGRGVLIARTKECNGIHHMARPKCLMVLDIDLFLDDRMPVQTRSKKKDSPVSTKGLNPFATEFDECKLISKAFAKCSAKDPSEYESIEDNPQYNNFVKKLIKQCQPYTGKRIFVVKRGTNISYVCPDYTLTLSGGIKLSISLARRGYIYVHFLKDYMYGTSDCVFKGDHLTIAPSGEYNIHFHVTRIMYETDSEGHIYNVSSYNTSFCSIPMKNILEIFKGKKMSNTEKQEWFDSQLCLNEYNTSFNKTVKDMLYDDTEMTDVVFKIIMKGISPR
jgi:hypothetical protein